MVTDSYQKLGYADQKMPDRSQNIIQQVGFLIPDIYHLL